MQYNQRPQITEQIAIELLKSIPSRPDYDTWVKIISSVANHFDESTALNILLSRFVDEKPNETLKKIKSKMEKVSIGTLVFFAKQNGADLKTIFKSGKNSTPYQSIKRDTKTPQKRFKALKKQVLYKSVMPNDDNLPDFVKHMIDLYISDGFTPEKAKQIVISNANFLEKNVPAFTIAVNKTIVDKNLDPQTKIKRPNYFHLTNFYKNNLLTIDELIESISKGFALCFADMKTNADEKIVRNTANFNYTNCFAIDVDSKLSIEQALQMDETQSAMLLYTSSSHSAQQNRFRIIFGLPTIINDVISFKEIVSHYITCYGADPSCSDPCRAFYGNQNATIYNLQSGEVLRFKNSVPL